jgi:hypothetical protein
MQNIEMTMLIVIVIVVAAVAVASTIAMAVWLWKSIKTFRSEKTSLGTEIESYRTRFPAVFDAEAEVARIARLIEEQKTELEAALHGEFELTRVNAQNYRKEFFRCSIEDVESAVKRLAPHAPFFKDMEAQEYRETLSRRRVALEQADQMKVEIFPVTL